MTHRPAWTTSCVDWADRIRRGDSIIPPPIFHDQAAEGVEIFNSLRIVDAPGSPTMEEACAEWLHDTVEDTHATLWGIEKMFGGEVAALVEMLTDVSVPSDGNRTKRKLIDCIHTAKASAAAKTIKLADLIDNTSSIAAHDPAFAAIYFAEKRLLLDVLREGDPTLWQRANSLLPEGLRHGN